uniref:Uncharacterized protein n=1 Tax=Setaria italica TaxID=4555 RepID=K3XME3_SETIT
MIPVWLCDSLTCRTGSGDELAELLWDNGPALRGAPPPFQPFTCSTGGSSRTHELKRHAAAAGLASVPLGTHDADLSIHDDAVPWLHCPVVDDDGDGAAAAGVLRRLAVRVPGAPRQRAARLLPPRRGHPALPRRAAPSEAAAKQAPPSAGEGVMNFTFFSRATAAARTVAGDHLVGLLRQR